MFCRRAGVCETAALEPDIVLNSVVGMVGLAAYFGRDPGKKDIASIKKRSCRRRACDRKRTEKRVTIYPVDSEHSAIFQRLQNDANRRALKKIILTASGGPFFGKSRAELETVTVQDALRHPNGDMGAKVTIDSATLMNKGLELIEAVWLFGMAPADIEIVVHRESIVHSLVEFADHSVLAQLGVPDMRLPIQYALTCPERLASPAKRLSLTECGALTFQKPDTETFRCLAACICAIGRGGAAPCTVNGANEEAVAMFLRGEISFNKIGDLVTAALSLCRGQSGGTVEALLEADREARAFVRERAAR
ncbi:MAG: 1-deoxy-D-xylulose-5-phosphate reductoisomerase [Oscillospiraceae bacterium]